MDCLEGLDSIMRFTHARTFWRKPPIHRKFPIAKPVLAVQPEQTPFCSDCVLRADENTEVVVVDLSPFGK